MYASCVLCVSVCMYTTVYVLGDALEETLLLKSMLCVCFALATWAVYIHVMRVVFTSCNKIIRQSQQSNKTGTHCQSYVKHKNELL